MAANGVDVADAATIVLLGRFEVRVAGRLVEVASRKERALLTRLALAAGTTVATESLVDTLWPDGEQPADPARALRYHVWHLRDLLEPDRADRSEGTLLLRRDAGYVLAVDPGAVDAVRVEVAWARIRSEVAEPTHRRDAMVELLDQWGPASFADTSAAGPLADAATRLDRLRTSVVADRITADISLGGGAELIPQLEALIAVHRYDERLRAHLMTALYRAGRQADALALYAATRSLLVEELGVEPGPELRKLERRILSHDPDLGADARTGAVAPIGHGVPTSNLPHPVDSFVGRSADITDLHRLLADCRLVTLTGAGGTGKTRLAIEATRPLVDRHADGVWLVELAPVTDSALVSTVVAETWRLSTADADIDEVVVGYLRDRAMVLIVDNCEHVHAATSALVHRVLRDAPGVRILATSRESLGVPGEVVVRVPGLAHRAADGAPGAAMQLFVDRGRAARPGWAFGDDDASAIERICQRLDGIPLGLELAAGRLRSMTPHEIADHLDRSVGVLAVAGKHGVPRQRSLAATVEWSYRLLSEPEQEMFRRVSVFAGGFDLAAAAAVCGDEIASVDDAIDLLDSLVDKSLVLAAPDDDGTRYRLLEPVRQWAHDELSRHDEVEEVCLAHAHHFARLVVDELCPAYHRQGQEAALRRTATDYPNIRFAIATLAELHQADEFLAMCFGLFAFWAHESLHSEGMDTCRRCLDLGDGDPLARVKVAFVGAVCGAWTRRLDAVDMGATCLKLAEELGSPRAVGWAELAVAVVSGNDGLPRGAGVSVPDEVTTEPMQRAVAAWAVDPGPAWWDPVWEHGLQQLCCSIFLPYGPERYDEFLASQAAFRAVGDRGWLAILYAQVLEHLEFAGVDTTRELLQEGASISISPNWSNAARYRLGVLDQLVGDHVAAIRELSRAIAYQKAIGDSNHGAELRFLAVSQCEIGRVNLGAELVLSAFGVAGAGRSEREAQRTLAVAAHVLEAVGQAELAAAAVGKAVPYQDNYVDTLGTVESRLRSRIGDSRADVVIAAGAARDLADLVGEVRQALVRIAG